MTLSNVEGEGSQYFARGGEDDEGAAEKSPRPQTVARDASHNTEILRLRLRMTLV
jgi:hypothetical protein